MKRIILISLLALSACAKNNAVETTNTNNPEIPVSLLFEKDGCKVYRFQDGRRYHYFVKCEGSSQDSTISQVTSGKNIRDVEITTVKQ